MSVLLFVPVFFVLALLVPTAWALGGAYLRSSGVRRVRCPEEDSLVQIELDVRRAVAIRLLGYGEHRVRTCSRWPERHGCGQACVRAA